MICFSRTQAVLVIAALLIVHLWSYVAGVRRGKSLRRALLRRAGSGIDP